MKTVWLVIKEGVYDQGVYYVATSELGALAFCEGYAPDKDGYHAWRIEEHAVGGTPEIEAEEEGYWGAYAAKPYLTPVSEAENLRKDRTPEVHRLKH